ncbi:MAG: ArsO family NAD(P)H-dependent flavin-containing monooxygenase [Bacteroidota bacterium]
MAKSNVKEYDVIIIGGGQSGLASAYYLRRSGFSYVILDEKEKPGGAWLNTWKSLKLFSPSEHSSLPGWMMPKATEEYPGRDHVIEYLKNYENRYKLPVERPVEVQSIKKEGDTFYIATSQGQYLSKVIVGATGSWKKPHIPSYNNLSLYNGHQVHSAFYSDVEMYTGKKALIVGGGNSGAQILAEVSKVANTTWVTLNEPKFLPDDVDGRYLFEFATRQYKAKLEGKTIQPAGSLGDVVMVESVKEARGRGVLGSRRPFDSFYEEGVIWSDGEKEVFDAVIWCTGFKPSLNIFESLVDLNDKGRPVTKGTKVVSTNGLWLVGYGSWTGFASATLIGVGRTARQTAKEVIDYLSIQL